MVHFFEQRGLIGAGYLKDLKEKYEKEYEKAIKFREKSTKKMVEVMWEVVRLVFVVAFYSKDMHSDPEDPDYSYGWCMFRH